MTIFSVYYHYKYDHDGEPAGTGFVGSVQAYSLIEAAGNFLENMETMGHDTAGIVIDKITQYKKASDKIRRW